MYALDQFQLLHQDHQMTMKMDHMTTRKRETKKTSPSPPREEDRVHVVDLHGMSLDSLPKLSLDLAIISKLNLSNNNLQVQSPCLTKSQLI